MDGDKYGKERAIRGVYRRMGRRRTYIQRRVYERRIVNAEKRDRRTNSENRVSLFDEDDFVSSTLSTSFGRSRLLNLRRRVWLRWRTRGPGRFRHEFRKRNWSRRIGLRRGTRRSWEWYLSEVDVNRTDGRRSRSFFLPLFWMKFRMTPTRREDRRFRIWRGRVRYRFRIPERTDLSNRRSRGRRRRGYLLSMEAWRRRRYRRKGRTREN